MIRRPPRSTQSRSSAASDVYKRQPGYYTVRPHQMQLFSILSRTQVCGILAPVSLRRLRAHETRHDLVCRLLLEKKKKKNKKTNTKKQNKKKKKKKKKKKNKQ